MMNQNTHEGVIRDHLEKLGCVVELDTELVGLEQDDEGVTAHVRVGSVDEVIKAQYLVGTDGARGTFCSLDASSAHLWAFWRYYPQTDRSGL